MPLPAIWEPNEILITCGFLPCGHTHRHTDRHPDRQLDKSKEKTYFYRLAKGNSTRNPHTKLAAPWGSAKRKVETSFFRMLAALCFTFQLWWVGVGVAAAESSSEIETKEPAKLPIWPCQPQACPHKLPPLHQSPPSPLLLPLSKGNTRNHLQFDRLRKEKETRENKNNARWQLNSISIWFS